MGMVRPAGADSTRDRGAALMAPMGAVLINVLWVTRLHGSISGTNNLWWRPVTHGGTGVRHALDAISGNELSLSRG